MKLDMQVAKNNSDLLNYLKKIKEKSKCELTQTTLSEIGDWSIDNGVLSHTTKGFFQVVGAVNTQKKQEHVVLYQPQSAITGLVFYTKKHEVMILLQARIEPGNTNFVQYGPTIQSTPANYLQHHGGKKTHYAELFFTYTARCIPIATSYQLDLGKRYFQKSKSHVYLKAHELFPTQESMIWAPLAAIRELLEHDNTLNADLRSLLSVFDWSIVDTYKKNNKEYQSSLQNSFFQALQKSSKRNFVTTPLTNLSTYKIKNSGVIAKNTHFPSVHYYHFSTKFREKTFWGQPLISVKRIGLVLLLMRQNNRSKEFLVTVTTELGISGGVTVAPSVILYPEEATQQNWHSAIQQIQPAVLCAQFLQCDEGGRFINHQTQYKLYMTNQDVAPKPTQYWISEHTLKNLLQSSCIISFQLRVICSLLER